MVATITAIVLGLLLCISLFANYQMYQSVSYYEQWYQRFATRVKHMRQELHRLDKIGAYRSDDEVGYFFEALKRMSIELFKMGFFKDYPQEPESPKKSAVNVTTNSQDTPMEQQQRQQVQEAMGPPNPVEIPPLKEQDDA